MKYLSVCSGIEAASVAWDPLGFQPVGFSEIEAFPSAVLAHHYPAVPNLGDLTRYREWPRYGANIVVGGTPCQSFSVAGLRGGLADPRGNLALTFLGLVDREHPDWVLWENVPGVLSADGGRAFGALLGGLAELGYGWAYRILDAQFFGLAQRRKRVFLVGHSGGSGAPPRAVLFDPAFGGWDPAPSRKTGQSTTGTLAARTGGGGHPDGGDGRHDQLIRVAPTLGASSNGGGGPGRSAEPLTAHDVKGNHLLLTGAGEGNVLAFNLEQGTSPTNRCVPGPLAPPLTPASRTVAFKTDQEPEAHGDLCPTLQQPSPTGGGQPHAVMTGAAVRRLTPLECERLQGFPDRYTLIPWRRGMATDGPRYRALGNSMAVPVMAWLGRRLQAVDQILSSLSGGPDANR